MTSAILSGAGFHRYRRPNALMKVIKRLTTNLVFLLPVIALVVGLISVSIANDKAQALYKAVSYTHLTLPTT